MATKKDFMVKVDGVSLNARHFGNMNEKDAVAAMQADGISNDPTWSAEAYRKIQAEIKKADTEQANEEKLAEAEAQKTAPKTQAPVFLVTKNQQEKPIVS